MNHQSVLFLDFDDVLCLNKPYGGYDVLQALSQVVKKTYAPSCRAGRLGGPYLL
jgi:GGDEF domain-containing protein